MENILTEILVINYLAEVAKMQICMHT